MDVALFYSWQSDRPEGFCRYSIRDAAEEALRQIDASATIDSSPRLDHDTKGESGFMTQMILCEPIRCRIEGGTSQFFYQWTYLGILVLRHLGWRGVT